MLIDLKVRAQTTHKPHMKCDEMVESIGTSCVIVVCHTQTNEERRHVQDKLQELEIQHSGLQDLIVTLKDGKGKAPPYFFFTWLNDNITHVQQAL